VEQTTDYVECCVLSGAIFPDHRDNFAFFHGDRDSLKRVDVTIVGVDISEKQQPEFLQLAQ
jgi:hypothetical protein